jgi:hypothetical protein
MGIFPVTTTGAGQVVGFPDVCKTPPGPVPVPYPNIAMLSDGSGSKKVKIQNKETLRKGDKIRMSSGDEAGVAMGVVSNKIKGEAELKMGWSKVKAEGKEVGHLTVMAGQNGGPSYNVPAGTVVTVMQ